ncbi:MAG: glycosyltransferase [Steroidobacteraceae bacterium]
MRSVVLATCEGERFVGEQLDSIVRQLSIDDEIIVSDDASTDGTVAVIAAMGDKRIRVLSNTARVGYVHNFQRALNQVRGDNIYFADQDDVWLPGKVQTLDRALERKSCVTSDAVVVDECLREIHPSYFQWRRARDFSAWSILLRPPIIGATLACTRRYLDGLLPLPSRIPHDFWISFNAAWDGALEVVPTPLILYRRHAAAISPTATAYRRSTAVIASERLRLIGLMLGRRLPGTRHSWLS